MSPLGGRHRIGACARVGVRVCVCSLSFFLFLSHRLNVGPDPYQKSSTNDLCEFLLALTFVVAGLLFTYAANRRQV